MSHTYTQLLSHIVFSTKNRVPCITTDLKPRLLPYMGGILRELDCAALLINGPADHVHVLASMTPKFAPAEIIGKLKSNSSGWVHKTFPQHWAFGWQVGYAAFSVSLSQKQAVLDYVASQEEHHHTMTFQEELLKLLKRHEIEYDERYLWE